MVLLDGRIDLADLSSGNKFRLPKEKENMLMTLINKNLIDQIWLQFIKVLTSCELPGYGQDKNQQQTKP